MVGSPKKATVYLLIAALLSTAFFANFPPLNAQEGATQMLISPETVTLPVGSNFTVTVNVTNVKGLYTWQAVLKYNGSVINCTGVWVPAENVFKGKIYTGVEPEFGKDYIDGYDYMMYAASLVGWDVFVNVDNGILFKANFTVINVGATRITFATKEHPARKDQLTAFNSFMLDSDLNDIDFSATSFCTVVAEGATVNLPPVARLAVYVPQVDTSRYVALRGYTPTGTIPYAFAYKGFPVTFNASASHDDGYITRYVWDFGDGNITETTGPVVVHIYNSTGRFTVTLTVFDNGEPPLNSTCQYIIVVGLLVERFDWSPFLYGLAGIIAVAIVVQSARKIHARLRMRKLHVQA